jgi:hypothetical protein
MVWDTALKTKNKLIERNRLSIVVLLGQEYRTNSPDKDSAKSLESNAAKRGFSYIGDVF